MVLGQEFERLTTQRSGIIGRLLKLSGTVDMLVDRYDRYDRKPEVVLPLADVIKLRKDIEEAHKFKDFFTANKVNIGRLWADYETLQKANPEITFKGYELPLSEDFWKIFWEDAEAQKEKVWEILIDSAEKETGGRPQAMLENKDYYSLRISKEEVQKLLKE